MSIEKYFETREKIEEYKNKINILTDKIYDLTNEINKNNIIKCISIETRMKDEIFKNRSVSV